MAIAVPSEEEAVEAAATVEEETSNEKLLLGVIAEYKRREYVHAAALSSLSRALSEASLRCSGVGAPSQIGGLPLSLDVTLESTASASQNAASSSTSPEKRLTPTLRGLVLDPAVHLELKALRTRLAETETALAAAKEAAVASNFSGRSVTGQRLIAKCRTLQSENAELGRALSENVLQQQVLQLGALKKHILFLKNQLRQLRELNADLDADNERLALQLQEAVARFSTLSQERDSLKKENETLRAALAEQSEASKSPKQTRSEKERHRSSSRQRQGSPYHSRSKRPPEASLRLSPRRNSRDRSSERPRDRDRDRDREGARDREGTRDRERRGARDREREGDRYRQAGDTGPSRSGTWDASPRGERNAPSHWRHSSRSPRSRLPSPSKHQRRRSTSSLEPRGSAPSRRERDTNSGKLSDSRALNSQLPHRDSSRDRRGRRSFSRGRG